MTEHGLNRRGLSKHSTELHKFLKDRQDNERMVKEKKTCSDKCIDSSLSTERERERERSQCERQRSRVATNNTTTSRRLGYSCLGLMRKNTKHAGSKMTFCSLHL